MKAPIVRTSLVLIALAWTPVSVTADPFTAPQAQATMSPATCNSKRAAIRIVGRIAAAKPNTYVIVLLTPRQNGDALIIQTRAQVEQQREIRAIGNDSKALQAYLAKQQAAAAATVKAADGKTPLVQPFIPSLADSVQIPVAKDGSFECDGVATGSYDVLASVSPLISAPTSLIAPGLGSGIQSTIYAAHVDVPTAQPSHVLLVRVTAFARQFVMGF